MTPYIEFLKSKIEIAPETGFDVKDSEIHPILKPHQRDAVKWALKGGRRALFEAFGLGKTIHQELLEAHDAMLKKDRDGPHGYVAELCQVMACCAKAIIELGADDGKDQDNQTGAGQA